MADVKWIKITTDMFDNRKIKHLRKLPEGNAIVLIWVMLLTLAGRCNAGGMVFLTETIPYTPKMLADELDFSENTVSLALEALKQLGMIQTDNFLQITNWGEYQNVDGLEKLREQTRQRVANFRERKALEACNVTGNVTVTHGNATDIDIDTDKDKEKEKERERTKKTGESTTRKRFVPPTLDEVAAFVQEIGGKVDPQRFLDYYASNGWMVGRNHMRDWKATVRRWAREDGKTGNAPATAPKPSALTAQGYTQRQYAGDMINLFEDDEGAT